MRMPKLRETDATHYLQARGDGSPRVRFRIQGQIDAPPKEVIRLFHDRVEKISGELPNIDHVELLEREADRTRIRWFAKGDIPYAFHKVVKPEDLYWEDDVLWDMEACEMGARVFRPGFKKLRCEVRTSFAEAEGTGTRYTVDGDLRIDIPMFGLMLERFFIGKTEANMREFYELLGKEVERSRPEQDASAEAQAETPEEPES